MSNTFTKKVFDSANNGNNSFTVAMSNAKWAEVADVLDNMINGGVVVGSVDTVSIVVDNDTKNVMSLELVGENDDMSVIVKVSNMDDSAVRTSELDIDLADNLYAEIGAF